MNTQEFTDEELAEAILEFCKNPKFARSKGSAHLASVVKLSDLEDLTAKEMEKNHRWLFPNLCEGKGGEREEEGGDVAREEDEGVGSAGNMNEGDGESGEKEIIGDKGSGDRTDDEDIEDENLVDESVEGEIPEESKADEREEEIVEGDDDKEDGTEMVDMDVDGSELSDRPELVEGTKFIVVPDERPEAEDTPATARANRRNARQSKKLERTRTSTRCLHLIDSESKGEAGDDIPQTQEMLEETGEKIPQVQENPCTEVRGEEFSPEAEVKRHAHERKRKGKQEATPLKKKQRQVSSTSKIREASSEPISVLLAEPTEENEDEEEEGTNQEAESVYETLKILLTKKLLEAMVHFDDPKLAETCNGRATKGKLANARKMYDSLSLQEIESEEEFLLYIRAIGCEWLLDHCKAEVLILLAKEFFTFYRFKSTMYPDADSISFRLFGENMEMSIRE
ncbi:neurofilament medium polypeptide-like [Salvia splendens]|uniref:neurofilament medium polypeptide-like n=1 Tax=Salvia splendens TaxID=180675 RepID=UPI001C270C37|nr:neurofilament medium polypeptide-like [Salvia splendens]